ncbi:abortive infection bacteriophage resistance protein [Lacibacter cauensis]|uniref:Abortive infection bacteriophage resistance protein n=1 Tax=Lacibacter cauensis TaxID=510947 RepID=A0A562SQ32_9BACT|nr:Abi family protein [Lacibacter cauensis]TWI83298.1 abortive infection bacteriophage resistance protein [Lacibacter cauensis]
MKFPKNATTIPEQLALLKKRGLKIINDNSAAKTLNNISYYRLSAYFLSFQKFGSPSHDFMPWADFKKVEKLYIFDRELRSILLDAIERIEVALRCRIVYEYCHRHGNNWYEDPSLFIREHTKFLKKVHTELGNSKEVFISHYYSKYTVPQHPPAWMSMEILSFGQISIMYKNLHNNDAKKAVARHFGVSPSVLESWLEHLVYIRNICAHHSRLWNRIMTVKATIPTKASELWISYPPSKPDKIYTTICIAAYLLERVNSSSIFAGKIRSLIKRFNNIDLNAAGFNKNWQSDPFWKSISSPFTHKIRIVIFSCINAIKIEKRLA